LSPVYAASAAAPARRRYTAARADAAAERHCRHFLRQIFEKSAFALPLLARR
jgi:hypothetical protein